MKSICLKNLLRLVFLIGIGGCSQPEMPMITVSAKKIEIRYRPGAILRNDDQFRIDSILMIHGPGNADRLFSNDTVFLTTTVYESAWGEEQGHYDTASAVEYLNKINFIFKNVDALSGKYETSPELSTLTSGLLVFSSSLGKIVTIRYPKDYPLEVRAIE